MQRTAVRVFEVGVVDDHVSSTTRMLLYILDDTPLDLPGYNELGVQRITTGWAVVYHWCGPKTIGGLMIFSIKSCFILAGMV